MNKDKWILTDILKESRDIYSDWSSCGLLDEATMKKTLEYVKYWCNIFFDDERNHNDNTIKCCYDLTLMYFLEDVDHIKFEGDNEIKAQIQNYARIVYEMLTCNTIIKSEINWDEV